MTGVGVNNGMFDKDATSIIDMLKTIGVLKDVTDQTMDHVVNLVSFCMQESFTLYEMKKKDGLPNT